MILGPISLLDCVVFVIFLVPQLLLQAGTFATLLLVVKCLPFLLFSLPATLCYERYILSKHKQSPFCQEASLFQDIVVRCVRFAFARIPAVVGRVFFSKPVALPFFRWRLLRHGYLQSPVHYQEIERKGLKGIWIAMNPQAEPDVVIYYCHGGGFSMGSAYFYLEFLIAWATCLKDHGYRNPAIFALDYTLVPDAQWPVQFNETRAGLRFLRESLGDGSAAKIVVSGDSAGATLILSMLLHPNPLNQQARFEDSEKPGLAILLSPWTHLVSELNQNTPSDYLNNDSLHLYAMQYAGRATQTDAVVSPGLSVGLWKEASPLSGYRIIYGQEEVFGPGIEEMVLQMRRDEALVKEVPEPAGIHAWPVVNLFLGDSKKERLHGLLKMTEFVKNSSLAPTPTK